MPTDPADPRPPRRARPAPPPEADEYALSADPVPPRRPPAEPLADPDLDAPTTFRPASIPAASARPKKPKARFDPDDDVRPVDDEKIPRLERLIFGGVSTTHLAKFCRQFASYTDAGVDLIRTLTSLQKQFARTALGPVLGRLTTAVRRGEAMSEAMAREPRAFDPLFLSMMRVAEARGGIPETLRGMADHYEARQRLVRQARAAMIYPVIVCVIAFGVGTLLTLFVLPALVGILEDMTRGKSVSLPLPTQILIAFNKFALRLGWWLVPLIVVGGGFALIRAYATRGGKALIDNIALYVPVLGSLLSKIDTARFARTLSTLLEAGVDLTTSLDLTAETMRLEPFRRMVVDAGRAVVDGTELSVSLLHSHRFDAGVIAIVETGEETGKLPESLAKLAEDYEEQVEQMVKNLGSLITPLIFIGLGAVALFLALAFVLAYIQVLTGLMGGM